MNKITLSGRLTNDVELKTYGEGKSVAIIKIASNGKNKEETDFFECKAFGKTGENIAKFKKKGDQLLVFGTMHQYRYQKQDGTSASGWELLIDEAEFIGGGAKKEAPTNAKEVAQEQGGDLPF